MNIIHVILRNFTTKINGKGADQPSNFESSTWRGISLKDVFKIMFWGVL